MPKLMKKLNTISRTQALFRQREIEKLGIYDLSPAKHTMVLAICRNPGVTGEWLARELCINKSTVTRAIASLLADGYIERIPNSSDKRELFIYPTEKMTAALPIVREISRRWWELISAGLSDEEIEKFDTLLTKIEKTARDVLMEDENEADI